ncbi:receptor-type tyrosine-protein phosphatase epsilon [Strongylocentrotus purpuratus]|uniref:protein-tyrosine-phosphatase n=1 Tax=Strongylocentrotus purpuratus TaxID=7668 RepID=A0A7M7PK90_STRPU|nr:receptor-type tyrosine-protein phosphatase epsilon [Strongylocentrotus purpuratus]
MRDNTEEIVNHGECTAVMQKTYMMDTLQACTMYRFQVQVVTRDYLQRGWDTVNAQAPTRAPGMPRNVRILSQGSDTVTWEAPTDLPCEPEGYDVTHKLLYKDMCEIPSDATKENRIVDVDSHLMRKTIQGLISYSQYQVCVLGTNAAGDGEPTCVNFTTGHEAPSKPPKKVKCSDQSYGSLTFTWNKPRCGDRNGPISHYEYILNASVSNVSILGSVNASENGGDITFTNLIPVTMYYFRVRANNDNLSGNYGPAVEAHTSLPIYRPPKKVVVTSWNETAAVIEWLAPDSSVFNTIGYTIACWQSGLQENTSIFVSYDEEVCASTCLMEAAITGLKPATNHSIQVTAVYKYGEEKSHVLQFQTPEEVRESSSRKAVMLPVLVCMFLLIFVLLLVIASLLYSRKTNRPLFNPERLSFSVQGILNALRRTGTALNKSVPMSSSRNRDHTEQELNGGGLEMEITCRVSETNNHEYNHEMESNMSSEIYENMTAQDTKHGAIPVGQLLGYMARRNAEGSNSLDDDFKSLPSQKLHPQYIALKAENKEKNRFINILPYDNSRVNLTVVHGDPHSDYINASFIDGYRTPKKYIAAQGPNKASVDDFWRMMWQYDCRKIVMLTNLRESNKKKCEQYWPTESVAYGGIWVSMTNEKKSDHYTVRYLNLVCNNTGRDVVQYHYTTWPDMGVPEYPSHLMNFIKITREPLKSPKGPTVVHCSAGVGRTGTFLTLDAMLDQIETEQAVHIHAFIVQMRQKRPNMVQTKKQYRFIYEALLQELTCGDTSIPRNAFGETCQSLLSKSNGVTGIQRQFELLEALTILPQDEETAAARSEDNASKNRFPDKAPVSRTRPFLMTEVEGGNDYINASFLPGYVTRNQFVGTQTPLPNTVVDFWRLVVDYKVETIVMLHGNTKDKKYSQYWPTEGSQRYGPFKIDVKKEEYKRPIMHRTLEVTKTDSKKAFPKTVKHLQLASCPPPLDVPPTLTDVIDLYRALLTALGSTEWKEGDSPLLVHCRDGEGMTGAFCAFLAVMDQLNAKQTIDVFHACKKLRTTRPGAVASLAQYQFIYEAVKSHLISSTIYENVTKKI